MDTLQQWLKNVVSKNFTIDKLQNLKRLDIHNVRIDSLPDCFKELQNLEILWVTACDFQKIPPILKELPRLETLWFVDNKIIEIPEWIVELKELTTLNLSLNNVTVIPDFIYTINKLTILHIYDFASATNALGKLRNIRLLSLYNNIPPAICKLKQLQSLWSDARITVPPNIGKLRNLSGIVFRHFFQGSHTLRLVYWGYGGCGVTKMQLDLLQPVTELL